LELSTATAVERASGSSFEDGVIFSRVSAPKMAACAMFIFMKMKSEIRMKMNPPEPKS
jgi:hypothetical protein